MAIFGNSKKNKEKKADDTVKAVKETIIKPRITEKATLANDSSIYTYEVDAKATKHSVMSEFVKKFGKTPAKINISTLPSKKRRRGSKAEVKKAYVYLKKGDTIDFFSA